MDFLALLRCFIKAGFWNTANNSLTLKTLRFRIESAVKHRREMRKLTVLLVAFFCISCNLKYNGIDVSHHNTVDWAAVQRDTCVKFCYVKSTEGSTHVDKSYRSHLDNAKKVNLKVGLYHYLSTHSSGKKQFDNFNRSLKAHQWDLIPAVDIEDDGNDFSDLSKVKTILKDFLDSFYQEYGFLPIVYYGDFRGFRLKPTAKGCKSWFRTLGFSPLLPGRFQQVAVESKYGGMIDLNYCKGIDYILLQ